MLGQEKAFKIMEEALAMTKADEMEIVLMGHDHSLTRYANSQIHQNTAEENATMIFKAVSGKRIGVSSTNNFHPKKIAKAVESALESAMKQVPIDDYPGLPQKTDIPEVHTWVDRTMEINPEEKALIIGDMIARTHGDRMSLHGAFYTGASELAVANSNGIRTYTKGTLSNITVITASADTSGYASDSSRNVDDLNHIALVEEALEAAKTHGEIKSLEPGKYPVLLEEYAVSEMLIYLASMGLTADSVENGHSFVPHYKGKEVFKPNISLYDDGFCPDSFAVPFDFEGQPRRRVDFIKNGVVTGEITHNNYTASKEGIKSTGHSLTPESGISRTEPFNMIMEPGTKTREEIIAGMERGVLVKRFHYLTTVHPLKTIISGMTRDGVFWVEDGKIKHRLRDMRFTQSILDLFKNTKELTSARKAIWFRDYTLDFPMNVVIPQLYVEDFNFTGQTEF
ncbi:MAG: TldD/PmbA family protein [Firmicutes bacterium]|nr:TldD/PmbA family protein [Bacillota bacterium]